MVKFGPHRLQNEERWGVPFRLALLMLLASLVTGVKRCPKSSALSWKRSCAVQVHSAWKRERGGQRNQRTCPPARFTTWLKNNVFTCLITRSWERKRERETRAKESLSRRKERVRVQRLAVLVIWLKWSNKIPTSYFSRLVGPVSLESPAACLALLCFHLSNPVICSFLPGRNCLLHVRIKRWRIDRLAWPY